MTVGQRLTAFYVDACIEHGFSEMVPMKGHIARRAKELLDCGVSEQKVAAAIGEFVCRRGRSALQLAEIHAELEREGGPLLERPSVRRGATEYIKAHGWPTGASWVRGDHGGSYRWDPLGTERIPSDYRGWPYERPTFEQIAEALAGVNAGAPPARREPDVDDVEIERGLPVGGALGALEGDRAA